MKGLIFIQLWTLIAYASMSMWALLTLIRYKKENKLTSNTSGGIFLIFLASPFMYPVMLIANIYDLIDNLKQK